MDDIQKVESNYGQNAQDVGRDQVYIKKLSQQNKILQKIFNTLNYNQQIININHGSLNNPAELKDGKTICIIPISNGLMQMLRISGFFYGFFLFIALPYAIEKQYFHPNVAILNITSLEHKIELGLDNVLLFFVAYFVLLSVLWPISYFLNKKKLTANSFDGIEFQQIRRILPNKKLFYQEVLIYMIDKLEPRRYIINQHDYWMIRDLWEAWLHTQVEKKLLESS